MKKVGFTLIELLVVIAIIAILAAILFPVFAAAREKARMTTCASNLKQLSLGVMQYIQDNDTYYPGLNDNGYTGGAACGGLQGAGGVPNGWNGSYQWSVATGQMWMEVIYPYVKSTGVYVCPSYPTTPYNNGLPWTTYGYNTNLGSANTGVPPELKPEYCEGLNGIGEAKIITPDHCILLADTVRYDYPYLEQGPQGNGQAWGSYPWIGMSNFQHYGTATACLAITNVSREGAHNGGANIAFCDGHVKWMPPSYGITLAVTSRNNASCNAATYSPISPYYFNPVSTQTVP